jgi:hypothetical protein
MIKITNPKFVRKANQWCITVFRGKKQEVKWFNSKDEALQAIIEIIRNK